MAVSSILLHFSSICESRKRFLGYVFFILSLIPPLFIATFRARTVGIDVLVYVDKYSALAQYNNPIFYFKQMGPSGYNVEIGYTLLNFVGAKIAGLNGVFFIMQLATLFPVYIRIYSYRDKYSAGILAWIYQCVFFTLSLNLVRQSIALSVIFFAYPYIFRSIKVYLLLLLVAFSFHFSAIMGILILMCSLVSKGASHQVKQLLFLSSFVFFLVFYNFILSFIINITNVEKYSAFLQSSNGYLSNNMIFLDVLIIIVSLQFVNKKTTLNSNDLFLSRTLLTISILNLVLYLLTMYNENNFRFSLYTLIISPLAIAKYNEKSSPSETLVKYIIFILLYSWIWFTFNISVDSYGIFR